jgi:hypothetical protein
MVTTLRPSKIDTYEVSSTNNGFQITRNGHNIFYVTDFSRAVEHIRRNATPGDTININVSFTLDTI